MEWNGTEGEGIFYYGSRSHKNLSQCAADSAARMGAVVGGATINSCLVEIGFLMEQGIWASIKEKVTKAYFR